MNIIPPEINNLSRQNPIPSRQNSYCGKNTLTFVATIFAVGSLIALTLGFVGISPHQIGTAALITGGVAFGLSSLFYIMAVKKHYHERYNLNRQNQADEANPPVNQQFPPQATSSIPSVHPNQRRDLLNRRNINDLSLEEIESLLSDSNNLSTEEITALSDRQVFLQLRIAQSYEVPPANERPAAHSSSQSRFTVQQPSSTPNQNEELFNGKLLYELTLDEIERILQIEIGRWDDRKIQRLVDRQEYLESQRNRQVEQIPTQLSRSLNPLNTPQETRVPPRVNPTPGPVSNPTNDNQCETETFLLEPSLFVAFSDNFINQLADIETNRLRFIATKIESGEAYHPQDQIVDPNFDEEIQLNYQVYNPKTFRWEPLKVRNKNSCILLESLDEAKTIGNGIYYDIYVLDDYWYTPEEITGLKGYNWGSINCHQTYHPANRQKLSPSALDIVHERKVRLMVRKKPPN